MKKLLIMLALAAGLVAPLVLAPSAEALNIFQTCDGDAPDSPICDAARTDDLAGIINNVISVLLFLIGIAAVIMIIIGGIMYTTSAGDTGKMTTAKNTILYSIVGLVIAIAAYAIVNFVLSNI